MNSLLQWDTAAGLTRIRQIRIAVAVCLPLSLDPIDYSVHCVCVCVCAHSDLQQPSPHKLSSVRPAYRFVAVLRDESTTELHRTTTGA